MGASQNVFQNIAMQRQQIPNAGQSIAHALYFDKDASC